LRQKKKETTFPIKRSKKGSRAFPLAPEKKERHRHRFPRRREETLAAVIKKIKEGPISPMTTEKREDRCSPTKETRRKGQNCDLLRRREKKKKGGAQTLRLTPRKKRGPKTV